MPRRLGNYLLRRDCNVQRVCRHVVHETDGALYSLPGRAVDLRSDLRGQSAGAGVQNIGRSMGSLSPCLCFREEEDEVGLTGFSFLGRVGFGGYRVWGVFLCVRLCDPVWVQCDGVRRGGTLHRRLVLVCALHAVERHDGLQGTYLCSLSLVCY